MPIVSKSPTSQIVPKERPRLTDPAAQTLVLDNSATALSTVMAYVDGAPWVVDWYAQRHSEKNDLRELDVGQSGVNQEYLEIKNYELRVTSPLSPSYDQEQGFTTVVGSANLFPFLTPNVDDYFIARTGDLEHALFRITQVDRKTFSTKATFGVEFEMVGYRSSLHGMFSSLASKVTQTYYYDKERHARGLAPLLRAQETQTLVDVRSTYKKLTQSYFRTFLNPIYKTLVLPGQDRSIYDPKLVDFIFRFVETQDCPLILGVNRLGFEDPGYADQLSIWDAIIERNPQHLLGMTKSVLIHKSKFSTNAYLRGIRWTSIDYVVYPGDPDLSTPISESNINFMIRPPVPTADVITQTTTQKEMAFYVEKAIDVAGVMTPLIQSVHIDNDYIFSSDFYDCVVDKTVLEYVVKAHINNTPVNLSHLLALSQSYHTWVRMDQFYYGPILMYLLKFYQLNDIEGLVS